MRFQLSFPNKKGHASYKNTAQHEKNKEIFEKGVRHGFWNVKTKEEIKEKYEKYKHLEDWYEP